MAAWLSRVEIGAVIRAVRKRMRLTQAQFAKQLTTLSVDQAQVSDWETRAVMPSQEGLAAVADLAGESIAIFWSPGALSPAAMDEAAGFPAESSAIESATTLTEVLALEAVVEGLGGHQAVAEAARRIAAGFPREGRELVEEWIHRTLGAQLSHGKIR